MAVSPEAITSSRMWKLGLLEWVYSAPPECHWQSSEVNRPGTWPEEEGMWPGSGNASADAEV